MATCLILGAYGLLGSSLSLWLRDAGHTVICQGRRSGAQLQMDVSNTPVFASVLEVEKIEIIINLIAETNVDKCEVDFEGAFKANMIVVNSLVEAIRACSLGTNPYLIHISSDQVYSGSGPHREEHPSPINIYGLSKLGGELIAQKTESIILRTNFIGRSQSIGRNGLVDWIVNSLKSNNKITVFSDVFFNPLHISTLCKIIELAILRRKTGIYNVSSLYGDSKANFALSLAKGLDLDLGLITIGSYKSISQIVKRPVDMRLNCEKFECDFGFKLPTFDSQIDLIIKEFIG